MQKTSILIVDDHQLIRDTWSFILGEDPAFEVVASCGSAEEALELVKRIRPDIVILDINLSGMNGMEALPLFRKFSPASRILGVSMHTQPTYAREMIKRGAMGYITKSSSRQEMFHALKEIRSGRKFICSEIKDLLTEQALFKSDSKGKGINDLSQRELEIIDLIRKGHSSREIAHELFIALKTVEVHRYNILKKLNLKNTAALVNFMSQHYPGEK
jgi:two-component system invasion response regulator UvrY